MKIIKAVAALLASAAVASATALSAFADYTYDLSDRNVAVLQNAKDKSVSGKEAQVTLNLPTSFSVRCTLFNELTDPIYWTYDDVTVSAEIRLDTEGVEAVGYIAGMGDGWQWIAPTEKVPLVYNEWVTITETGMHLYEGWIDAGNNCIPSQVTIDLRNAETQPAVDNVKFSIRNVKISGPAITPFTPPVAETTTVTTTTEEEPEPAESEVSEVTSEPEQTEETEKPEESEEPAQSEEPEETAPASTTTPEASETPENSSEIAPAQSSIGTAAPVNVKNDGTIAEREEKGADLGIGIVIVAISVVVVLAVAAAGFFIFKKKK